MRGYRLSSSGNPGKLDEAAQHLDKAVNLDPAFALAHATLSVVCASRHFEVDPSNVWLEKAELHCRKALELNPDLPESHVASAFLLWGPSKNFQHLEAIAELKRALALQNNLPQAYNRLGTILAHIGLLDHAREMYERARSFHPRKAISHSIVQAYMWNQEYDLAHEEIEKWHAENPANKYADPFRRPVRHGRPEICRNPQNSHRRSPSLAPERTTLPEPTRRLSRHDRIGKQRTRSR